MNTDTKPSVLIVYFSLTQQTARVAGANADNAVQVHGGNGFALEFPVSRILCDARSLSMFEGAAEIQAQVIARRLLAAGH